MNIIESKVSQARSSHCTTGLVFASSHRLLTFILCLELLKLLSQRQKLKKTVAVVDDLMSDNVQMRGLIYLMDSVSVSSSSSTTTTTTTTCSWHSLA